MTDPEAAVEEPEPSDSLSDPGELLLAFLDYYRDVIRRKVDGLPEADLRSSRLPSGWTPLELVWHLVFMERRWLQWGFAGEDVPDPWGDDDPATGRWHVEAGRATGEVMAALGQVGERTRDIVGTAPLETRARTGGRFPVDSLPPTLGWILLHVLQEYARHAGHLDTARELIDGAVGE
jgi:uncharacterized damage-inducible protein DinB